MLGAFLLLAALFGVVAASSSSSSSSANDWSRGRPLLSSDCSRVAFADMTAIELQRWGVDVFAPAYTAARAGGQVVRYRYPDGDELEAQVDADDPEAIAAWLFAVLAGPSCSILTYGGAGLQFSTRAAECVYLALELATRAELAADTGRAELAAPADLVAAAQAACDWTARVAWAQTTEGGLRAADVFARFA